MYYKSYKNKDDNNINKHQRNDYRGMTNEQSEL